MRDFLAATRDRVVVFDGGMGATLEQFDLSLEKDYKLPGRCHEALVLNRPDVIQGVHESMVEAGAEVVETDTFQASRLKLEEWGLEAHTLEINRRAAEIARKAVGENRFVAGSIGPTGFLPASEDPSLGQIRFRELVEVFARAVPGPARGRRRPADRRDRAGHPRGQGRDLRHARGVQAAGRSVPIQACVSLLPNGGKMLLGTDISAALATLEALKVDVIGLNCSTGPEDMRDAIRFLGEYSPLPVHCIPNAGIPHQGPDGETVFPEEPGPLAEALGEFVERYGVGIVGGCCGTTPEHIRAIKERCGAHEIGAAPGAAPAARLVDDRRGAARAGAGADDRRRARELAGLAQGQGAAAGRRLRRPAAGRRGPGRGRRARARPLRRADRAPGRGRADAARGQEGLAHAAVADPGRLDRARGDRDRAGPDPGPRDRQLGQPRGRRGQAQPRRPDRDGARRRADRADDRRGRHGQDPRAQARGRARASSTSSATSTGWTPSC